MVLVGWLVDCWFIGWLLVCWLVVDILVGWLVGWLGELLNVLDGPSQRFFGDSRHRKLV